MSIYPFPSFALAVVETFHSFVSVSFFAVQRVVQILQLGTSSIFHHLS